MCLIALIGLAVPRFALFLMWLLTDRLKLAFDSFLIGALGFVLLPFTTLFYALSYSPTTGVKGLGIFITILGFLFDLGSYSGGREGRRRRQLPR